MWAEIRENINTLLEAGILVVVLLEYFYDRQKDIQKQHKKTKTTKKTTKNKDGAVTEEEITETSEPMAVNNLEGKDGGDKQGGKN